MVIVKLYIEGGGQGHLLDTLFRQGWTSFFKKAGLAGRMPRIVRGGGRQQTFDTFRTAVQNPRPGELPLLLVDSEGPLQKGHTVWQHLAARDGWDRPAADAEQAFLMVEVMETWFLADRRLLREFFGSALRENALQEWRSLEKVPKLSVLGALGRATAACGVPYAKGKISFDLLSRLDAGAVERACPHAKRLLDRLRAL